jgi:N-acyl-phosphatidylethanolamine-hydrolysing phospholipase D
VEFPVCPSFAEIGNRFGPFDAAFLPIGAYSPRFFMSAIHCSPEDAVGIHLAVRAKRSIGMHWGTFKLTDEAIMEPPVRLEKVSINNQETQNFCLQTTFLFV